MTTTRISTRTTNLDQDRATTVRTRSCGGTTRRIVGAGIAAAVAAMTFTGVAAPAYAGPETATLHQNEQLNPGQRLITSNGIALVMQRDGNLVEYAPGNRAVWASNTNRADSVLRMQGDGNLVIIAPGNVAVWSTRTNGNTGSVLQLQTDGNAVVYAPGNVAKWANGVRLDTGGGASLGQRIVDTARGEAGNSSRNIERGGYNCNYYTGALGAGATNCSNGWRTQEWCADFGRWVWKQAGARVGGLDGRAASFHQYGRANGTWRSGANASNARVGDAVVFKLSADGTYASHVGIVTAVHGNGQITTIEGNAGSNTDRIHTTTFTPSTRGVSGYTSPVS